MGSGELSGVKKCMKYFGAKELPSVYSDHVGAPTYSKASQAVSCLTLFVASRSLALVSLGRVMGANRFYKNVVLLLLGQDSEPLDSKHNSSCRTRRNERYQVL